MNKRIVNSKGGLWGLFFASTFLTVSDNVNSMNKLLLIVGLVVLVVGCQATTQSKWVSRASMENVYFHNDFGLEWAPMENVYFHNDVVRTQVTTFLRTKRFQAISRVSKKDANNLVLKKCNKYNNINTQTGFYYKPNNYKFCYLRGPYLESELTNFMKEQIRIKLEKIKEHRKSVVANNLKKQEEEKITIENEKKIEQENIKQQELASLLQKQQTCVTLLGSAIGTKPNGECVLILMQIEVDLNKIEEEKTVYVQSGDSNRVAESLARQALRQQQMNNSLMLMQQGYNLMKPKPRINCNTTLMGWTCY